MPTNARAPETTEEILDRLGRRYAVTGRTVVGVLLAVLAPFAGPPGGMALCAAVSVAFIAWSAVYHRLMVHAPRTAYWIADVVVLCGLSLAQPLLVDPAMLVGYLSWVAPVVSFAVVALQWHVRPLPAALATAAVCVAFVAGAVAAPGVTLGQALAAGGIWTAVEAMLSRLLWQLVRRGGRTADGLMARRFDREREAALAAARRADQRAHWATVHDTAASTLLMVGLGEVGGHEAWLRGQIRRDIAALRGRDSGAPPPRDPEGPAGGPAPSDQQIDLLEQITAAAGRARVAVEVRASLPVCAPAPVATAIAGGVAEALENVRRHAGTSVATLLLQEDDGRISVTVADAGRGFDPDAVPPGRFGLSWSVVDRMDRAGGSARVESAPGAGTRVHLEWPRA